MSVVLSRHAAARVAEFGIGLDVVDEVARRPDVTHTNAAGERVCTSDRHPQWTVVVGEAGVVVTVLRRLRERWEHAPAPVTPSPPAATGDEVRPVVSPPPDAPGRPVRRTAPASPRVRSAAASHVVIDPVVMRHAVELSGGDPHRLVLNADGSVTVLNRARGSAPTRTGVTR